MVVTGGGTGIGRAAAAWFARQGDDVTIVGRRAAPLAAAAAALGATSVVADLTRPDDARKLAAAVPATVHVLVNNAGGNTDFVDAPPEDDLLAHVASRWTANWTANVLTAVLTTTTLVDRLAPDGRIVNVGSIAAPNGAGSYGAAKAAIESWTVDLARQLGPRGITANVVAPGIIDETEFFHGHLSEARRTRLIDATATGRAGHPDDVAAAIGFLASSGAGHITGQVLHVNGGAHRGR